MSATARRRAAYRAGHRAEAAAAWWLRLKGYRVLERRFRVPVGEIDLIARRGSCLAMVEVKARGDAETAAAAVSHRQRRRISRAAAHYLARRPDLAGLVLRFDVMVMVPWRAPRHIMDAWRL